MSCMRWVNALCLVIGIGCGSSGSKSEGKKEPPPTEAPKQQPAEESPADLWSRRYREAEKIEEAPEGSLEGSSYLMGPFADLGRFCEGQREADRKFGTETECKSSAVDAPVPEPFLKFAIATELGDGGEHFLHYHALQTTKGWWFAPMPLAESGNIDDFSVDYSRDSWPTDRACESSGCSSARRPWLERLPSPSRP